MSREDYLYNMLKEINEGDSDNKFRYQKKSANKRDVQLYEQLESMDEDELKKHKDMVDKILEKKEGARMARLEEERLEAEKQRQMQAYGTSFNIDDIV